MASKKDAGQTGRARTRKPFVDAPLECEDCGEDIPVGRRRLRCSDCQKLVCSWCAGHVHNVGRQNQASEVPHGG